MPSQTIRYYMLNTIRDEQIDKLRKLSAEIKVRKILLDELLNKQKQLEVDLMTTIDLIHIEKK